MTPRQCEFFRELLAPFPASAYSTKTVEGRPLPYLRSSATIENRLDDIVGPMGWTTDYPDTRRLIICRLKILCPDNESGWLWHYKEGVSGPEDMGAYDKKTGEWETDVDNYEKSAFTRAFRHAADQWGFNLYQQGVPSWLVDLYAQISPTNPPGPKPVPSPLLNGKLEPNQDWIDKWQPRAEKLPSSSPLPDLENEVGLNNCFFRIDSIVNHDDLRFRSPAEVSVYTELNKRRLLFFPNPAAVFGLPSKKREPDFLICHNGKWGVLEVMGETYHTNAVKDHDRARLFKEHGLLCIEFFPAKRCETEPAIVVDEFLAILGRHYGA
jgi:hypothetical protein